MIKEIGGWFKQVMLLDHQIKSLEEKLKTQSQQIKSLEDRDAAREFQIKALEERGRADVNELRNELRRCTEGLYKLSNDFPPLFQEVKTLAEESKASREDDKERERDINQLSKDVVRMGVKLESQQQKHELDQRSLVQQLQISMLRMQPIDSFPPAQPPLVEQAQLSSGFDGDSAATEFDEN